jgi:Mechanosensitive ion channel, conserved TM helix
MGDKILNTLTQTMDKVADRVMQFLPQLLVMVIIVIIGLVIAWVLQVVVRRVLGLVKLGKISETSGVTAMLSKAALPSPVELLSRLVFWVVWLAFILLGVEALGVTALQEQIARLLMFLPQIFVALLILFVGLLAANFFSRATLLAAANANYPSPRLLATVVRLLIAILAVTMAFEQLGLGQHAVLIAFAIAFGAVMMGLALAFGLGGRDVARRILEKKFSETEEEEEDDVSPL